MDQAEALPFEVVGIVLEVVLAVEVVDSVAFQPFAKQVQVALRDILEEKLAVVVAAVAVAAVQN